MEPRHYELRFLTPAFLGDGESSARWRTPPFKALLRHWWRIAVAAEHDYDHAAIREREARLFGHAWLEGDKDERGRSVNARRSAVRLRLSHWRIGTLTGKGWSKLQPLPPIDHPEAPKRSVGSDLYLGFGPVELKPKAREPSLKANAAIAAGETARLSIAAPSDEWPALEQAMGLMARYGTLGGRSRNGWGSLAIEGVADARPDAYSRPWREALRMEWPHAIGLDESGQPLIWQTAAHRDWRELLQTLARVKVGLRTQFVFTTGNNADRPEPRHWLSYPVTRHKVRPWGMQRLPNTLRFKVREAPDGALIGVVFHVPHRPPRVSNKAFKPDDAVITETWQRVHGLLDELTRPAAQRDYPTIDNDERRQALRRNNLDAVTLERTTE